MNVDEYFHSAVRLVAFANLSLAKGEGWDAFTNTRRRVQRPSPLWRSYLTDVLRLEPGVLRILPYYTSISIVRALGDRRMIGALGDVAHLE